MLRVHCRFPAKAAPIYTVHEGAQEVLQYTWVGGATSRMDLPSLTELSVAGCGPSGY